MTTLFGVCFGIFGVVSYFTGHVEGSGWTSVVILILIFGGVQLMSLGMVSEYVGRTYEEVKRRPRYVISSMSGIEEAGRGGERGVGGQAGSGVSSPSEPASHAAGGRRDQ